MIKIEKILTDDNIPENIALAIEEYAGDFLENFESPPELSLNHFIMEAEIKITGYFVDDFTGE